MRIQHNISAINANRNLGTNNSALSKSLEKLSSGYKINRAGDNAAGLAISEKMRAQITCLTQAETNCNDGVSLIQTAEGALQEVHSMLNRMTELAEQSANGTYEDTVDRKNLEDELSQLKEEITRVASATNFNGITLLDGSLNATMGDLNGTKFTIRNGGNLETAADALKYPTTARADGISGQISATGGFTLTNQQITKDAASKTSGIHVTVTQTDKLEDNSNAGKKGIYKAVITMDRDKVTQRDYEKWNGVEITVDTRNSTATAAQTLTQAGTGAVTKNGSLSLQIGDTSDPYNKLTVSVADMSSKGLGIDGQHVSDQQSAADALKVFKDAINTVSSTRGTLGAMQNRLEHTINNLSTTNENITNAESRIRDTDMAKEMMTFTSKSILSQAAQSMLAQANQQPQQVLSLLQ